MDSATSPLQVAIGGLRSDSHNRVSWHTLHPWPFSQLAVILVAGGCTAGGLLNKHQLSYYIDKALLCPHPISIQLLLLSSKHLLLPVLQHVTMSTDPSDQHAPLLTSPGRLQKIDQLRERNIGTYLPLPQLVAVGDQSSGKSSLLESLTGIPFPRGQELCTRYATQITHRREAQQRIDITIIPGPHASQDHKKKLESYRRHVQTTAQLRTEFPVILAQVTILP